MAPVKDKIIYLRHSNVWNICLHLPLNRPSVGTYTIHSVPGNFCIGSMGLVYIRTYTCMVFFLMESMVCKHTRPGNPMDLQSLKSSESGMPVLCLMQDFLPVFFPAYTKVGPVPCSCKQGSLASPLQRLEHKKHKNQCIRPYIGVPFHPINSWFLGKTLYILVKLTKKKPRYRQVMMPPTHGILKVLVSKQVGDSMMVFTKVSWAIMNLVVKNTHDWRDEAMQNMQMCIAAFLCLGLCDFQLNHDSWYSQSDVSS